MKHTVNNSASPSIHTINRSIVEFFFPNDSMCIRHSFNGLLLQTLEKNPPSSWLENQAPHSSEHCQVREANHYTTWVAQKSWAPSPTASQSYIVVLPQKSISHRDALLGEEPQYMTDYLTIALLAEISILLARDVCELLSASYESEHSSQPLSDTTFCACLHSLLESYRSYAGVLHIEWLLYLRRCLLSVL